MFQVKKKLLTTKKNGRDEGIDLLKKMLGVNYLEFYYNENGKPYILKGPYFSISHTDNMVICAISSKEIGIDIEKIRDYDENVKKIVNIDAKDNKDFFIKWTKKEAVIKRYGLALKDINSVDEKEALSCVCDGFAVSICGVSSLKEIKEAFDK